MPVTVLAWIVLSIFWVFAVVMLFAVSWRHALSFAGLWVLGLVVFMALQVKGHAFVAYEVVLVIIMLGMLKAKMGAKPPQTGTGV